MTIIEVYEKYKHLDNVLCDMDLVYSFQSQARYDMWQAIRASQALAPQADTPTNPKG